MKRILIISLLLVIGTCLFGERYIFVNTDYMLAFGLDMEEMYVVISNGDEGNEVSYPIYWVSNKGTAVYYEPVESSIVVIQFKEITETGDIFIVVSATDENGDEVNIVCRQHN